MKEDFTGPIIMNELNIDQEEGLENVKFEQLDNGRVLMKSPKRIYVLFITSNQFGQIQNLQIKFAMDFSLHSQTFSARHCLDAVKNDYDVIFLNSRYSLSPYNSNIFLLIPTEDVVQKKFKSAANESLEQQQHSQQTPQILYKLRSQMKFDNWAMVKEFAFCDKEKPQWQNYYFTMVDLFGKSQIYKCERMIRPKCLEMDAIFKTEEYNERIFEINNTYFTVSCQNNKTFFFEKKNTQILLSPLNDLFITNSSTIAFIKDELLEGTESRPIFIQMTASKLRIVDVQNLSNYDVEIELHSSQQQYDIDMEQKPQLSKLVYLCNTIFLLDSHRNLYTFSYIQERWEKVNHFGTTLQGRCIIGLQSISPYFTSTSSQCSDFLFIGFPNEFCIYSSEYNRNNGQIRFAKRFEAHYVKEGLVFLSNGLLHLKKDLLKENLMRSITDPSIKLSYDPRETHTIFVSEYQLLTLKKSLVLVIKLNTGDIYIYKGVLKAHMEQAFPYDFQRQPIRCEQYINSTQPSNLPDNFEEMRNTPGVSEKELYSFQGLTESIFLNTSIDCAIITDIGRPGACITIFENNSQELFFHLMLLPNISKSVNSLASFSLNNDRSVSRFVDLLDLIIIGQQIAGFLIPVNGTICFYQMQMNLTYSSAFIYEIPNSLTKFNPLFIDIVRVTQMKGGEDGNSTETSKKWIVLVNQIGQKHEIRLVDEDNHEETRQIKVLQENEKVYKFKTFEGTNKKEGNRYKIQLVGYLTQNILPDNEDEVESRFYCHYVSLQSFDPMPEMTNTSKYKDFIFDFCFLNFPRTNDANSSDHFKVILMERDKVMTLNFSQNQITQSMDDGPYHQRLIISSIWNNKQYFLTGDIQKGVQLYEMDEKNSRPKLIGEENMNINVRQCVLFSLQNKNALRALITDEARNVYAYSFTQQASQQGGGDVNNISRKISMELVANFHLGSKVNKITTDYKMSENTQYDAASHLLLQKSDGNLSVIQMIYEPGENTLLFDLQKTIFEEMPYVGGLDPREFRETKLVHPSFKLKNAHGFFETSILDIYFNLTRPLQERIASKLNRSRDDFIKMIIDTILS